jgi:hypothetical protein
MDGWTGYTNAAIEAAKKHGIMPEGLAALDQNLRGTLAIKVPGITGVIKFGDWRWMRIFNRVCFIEDDQDEKLFFATGKGQTLQGGNRTINKVDTNQPRQGDSGLPTDWAAYIYSPRLSVVYVSGTDDTADDGDGPSPANYDPASLDTVAANDRILFEVNRKILFRLEANDKERQTGHLIDYPQGGGINTTTTDVGFNQSINGLASPRDAHQLVVPVQFDANQQFQMIAAPVATLALFQAQQVNDRDNTSIVVECDLEGLYKVKVN